MSFSSTIYSISYGMSFVFRVYTYYCWSRGFPRCITLHLFGWNLNSHLSDHFASMSKSFCRTTWSSGLLILLKILDSSANMYTFQFILEGRSFMYRTKRIGPNTLPCGIPLVTFAQSEWAPFTCTCCMRSVRKACTHRSVWPVIPNDLILPNSLRCGTVSNALRGGGGGGGGLVEKRPKF